MLDSLFDLGFAAVGSNIFLVGVVAALWASAFFVLTVGWVVFLSSQSYPPDPLRLILDVLVSGFFTITAFTLLYRGGGIIDTLDASVILSAADHLYFSIVTFSTLGFGDFRPTSQMRLAASLQAILGNLHLGLLAGAAFYAMQFRPVPKSTGDNGDQSDDEQQGTENL